MRRKGLRSQGVFITQKQRITMKSIEEIIKELTSIEKVQTLISMIDTPMGGRRKYPKGIILLAQS